MSSRAKKILEKKQGWMRTTDLINAITKEYGISEKGAYDDLAKALKEKEVKKIELLDRTVLNGLESFPIDKGFIGSQEDNQPKKLVIESEFDKARAYQIIRSIEALIRPLTQEEWTYLLQKDGKSMLDKAKALQLRISIDALT